MIKSPQKLMTRIPHAVRAVCSAIREEPQEPRSWECLDEDGLWRELVSGILGSRVRYEVALQALDTLDRARLLDGKKHLSRLSGYEREVEALLSGETGGTQTSPLAQRYPFPRQRASRIRQGVEEIYGKHQTLRELLRQTSCPCAVRQELVSRIPGIGPKQASMFLRNVGFPGEFAVLDVHVLTYMRWNALLTDGKPRVGTLREYESVESVFLAHAYSLGMCPHEFDIAVWIVMRVATKEDWACR